MTGISSETRAAPLHWNKWIRQIHRWLSIAFTLSVILTFIALAQAEPLIWVSYLPLFLLFLLVLTGLDRIALPSAAKWRCGT